MIALVRYTGATVLHSQRYLGPVLLFMAALGVASINETGALPPLYGLASGALFVCATWLAIALISTEDPVHRAITVVNAGNSRRVLLATVSVAAIGSLILAAAGLVFPLLVGTHDLELADVVLGVEAEFTGAATGIAAGLLCSRLVIRRQGYALIAAIALVMTLLLVPGLPPVNVMIRLMANATHSAELIAPATGLLAIAVGALLLASVATHLITTRKD